MAAELDYETRDSMNKQPGESSAASAFEEPDDGGAKRDRKFCHTPVKHAQLLLCGVCPGSPRASSTDCPSSSTTARVTASAPRHMSQVNATNPRSTNQEAAAQMALVQCQKLEVQVQMYKVCVLGWDWTRSDWTRTDRSCTTGQDRAGQHARHHLDFFQRKFWAHHGTCI